MALFSSLKVTKLQQIMKSKIFFGVLMCLFLFSSCTNNTAKNGASGNEKPDSIFNPMFAKYFTIEYYSNYKKLTIFNPWNYPEVLSRYYLVNNNDTEVPDDGLVIKTPLETVAVASCSHVAFIDNIGSIATIKGVCSPNLIYNKIVREAVSKGECSDLGDSFSIGFEPTIMLNPQLLFTTEYNQTDQHIQRIKEAGIPVVNTVEWIEPEILGRAEWIIFIAAFFNKEESAVLLYNNIVSDYDETIQMATNSEHRPSILPGLSFKGTWYMPAGKSFMNQIFADAECSYYFSDNTDSGSIPLSFEFVLHNFKDCDVWIGLDVNSYDELLQYDTRLALFKPFKTKNGYNNNKRSLDGGANDFWENGVVHPEWLLKDLVITLHPEVAEEGDTTIFIKPLN